MTTTGSINVGGVEPSVSVLQAHAKPARKRTQSLHASACKAVQAHAKPAHKRTQSREKLVEGHRTEQQKGRGKHHGHAHSITTAAAYKTLVSASPRAAADGA